MPKALIEVKLGEKQCHLVLPRKERKIQKSQNYRNLIFGFFLFSAPNFSTFARRRPVKSIRLRLPCWLMCETTFGLKVNLFYL
jgi:hypothetical protein